MAATVSSPWGKPGAWALDAEEHEAELQQEQQQNPQQNTAVSGTAEFPSLAIAAATKQPKKKKNQTLSLAEFSGYGSNKPAQTTSQGLTHEDLLNLPTGPRQRSAEELDRSRLGGGFKSYGLNYRNGDDSSNSSRWGAGNSRVSNREAPASREFAPSRADETDDWSKTKKSTVGNGYERRERGLFFESQSKADESDSWVSNKPTTEARRFGGGNSGFERRGSFDSLSRERHVPNGGDSDNWGRRKEESNGAGPGGRPKLVLQPRTLPVSNGNGTVPKPKGSSPFGEARPREEVLAEKGKDYKEIDEKLEAVKINKEEKGERGDVAASFGRRSFGSGRGGSGSGNERTERSWRKPEIIDSVSRPQRFVS